MKKQRLLGLMMLSGILSGCASTTVILVANPNGQIGEVTVKTPGHAQTLVQAGASTRIAHSTAYQNKSVLLNESQINRIFNKVMTHEPLAPKRFPIHFGSSSIKIDEDAINQLRLAFAAISYQKSCNVRIIGHSDGSNSSEQNQALSIKQMTRVRIALLERSVDDNCLSADYYGESDPLIKTATGVSNSINQRVEIEVR